MVRAHQRGTLVLLHAAGADSVQHALNRIVAGCVVGGMGKDVAVLRLGVRAVARRAVLGIDAAELTGLRRAALRRWAWSIRLIGAGLLLAMAWIHEHLYELGFRSVPTIGTLFRLDAGLGLLAALAVLATPVPWWRLACAAGAALQLGTLGALLQSLTIGAFGFHETFAAAMIRRTMVVESLGFVVLAIGALARWSREGAHT